MNLVLNIIVTYSRECDKTFLTMPLRQIGGVVIEGVVVIGLVVVVIGLVVVQPAISSDPSPQSSSPSQT